MERSVDESRRQRIVMCQHLSTLGAPVLAV